MFVISMDLKIYGKSIACSWIFILCDFNLLTSYIKNTITKVSGEPVILYSVFDKFAKGKEHLNIVYVSHLFMPETSFKACL